MLYRILTETQPPKYLYITSAPLKLQQALRLEMPTVTLAALLGVIVAYTMSPQERFLPMLVFLVFFTLCLVGTIITKKTPVNYGAVFWAEVPINTYLKFIFYNREIRFYLEETEKDFISYPEVVIPVLVDKISSSVPTLIAMVQICTDVRSGVTYHKIVGPLKDPDR